MNEEKHHYQTVWNSRLSSEVNERGNEVWHYVLKFAEEC